MKMGILARITLCVGCLLMTAVSGCRSVSLSLIEEPVGVGDVNDATLRAAILCSVAESNLNTGIWGEDLFMTWRCVRESDHCITVQCRPNAKFSVDLSITYGSGSFTMRVLDAQNLRFDPDSGLFSDDRTIHRRAAGWIKGLKNLILKRINHSGSVYEIRNCVVSVSPGVTLKDVLVSVCKKFDFRVEDLTANSFTAIRGNDPERLVVKCEFGTMSYSLFHERPQGAMTNGFQYDQLMRWIQYDVERYADKVAYEIRKGAERAASDRACIVSELNRLNSSLSTGVRVRVVDP